MGLLKSTPFRFSAIKSTSPKMSCPVPVNTFNKSKEDFIWFVKKAVNDKKSYSHSEMYHSLLKLFVAAAAMPRAYGYAPSDAELYKTETEKDASRQKMFDSMDLKATGVITFDEWLKFCREHIAAKTATMDPHPIIDQGSVDQFKNFIKAGMASPNSPEHLELYWYMLEIFTDHDPTREGIVKMSKFPAMMNELLAVPKKHGLATPAEDQYETLFKKYDPRKDGRLTVDEWISLVIEEVYKKF